MYELIKVAKNTYYINCPAKIGIYRCEDDSVYLIDSGNDKDTGRRVRKVLDENGWRVKAILNTHSNADHIGGNKYFQQNFGCKIYAPGIEAAFTKSPVLEPSFLYGGYPCKDLRHKFLLAQESDCEDIKNAPLPEGFEVLPLPGHFFDMVGFRTPDDVVFLADCVSSAATLEKYQIGFIYDVKAYLGTLDKIDTLTAAAFVPSHAEETKDIRELSDLNRRKVQIIAEKIVGLCAVPSCFEDVLQKIFTDYGLVMNFEQYVLVGSTVRSYLAWLRDEGRLNITFEDNRMLWQAV